MNPPAPALDPRGAARRIVFAEQDRFLARDIERLSGTNLSRCYHCGSCGNGCPFIRGMDYPPNGIIRLVQYGLRQQALESHTIWICVGCHTCSVQCPMGIDIAAVMATPQGPIPLLFSPTNASSEDATRPDQLISRGLSLRVRRWETAVKECELKPA